VVGKLMDGDVGRRTGGVNCRVNSPGSCVDAGGGVVGSVIEGDDGRKTGGVNCRVNSPGPGAVGLGAGGFGGAACGGISMVSSARGAEAIG
jgi:hypothetical protein